MTERLLSVDNLKVSFATRDGDNQAVRGISFHIDKGETLGIVGESGSGKSVTARSIMSLISSPGRITDGSIQFRGQDCLTWSEKEWRKLRGNRISMIFQDPMTSLNPLKRIGQQLTEVLRRHRGLDRQQANNEAERLLREVGISDAKTRLRQYPHEFSGGMRQRVMIAMALSCQPDLLIADEPTTALDATIQAQILDLFKNLKQYSDTSIALITHDLGVVAQVCTRVIVMYGGLIMEEGRVEDIFYRPQHPYTKGLLGSLPQRGSGSRERLVPIEGTPPNLLAPPSGCPFAERCPQAFARCAEMPPIVETEKGHYSMCWLSHQAATADNHDLTSEGVEHNE
ncbi:ABC transporter ATP-binding protein [Paenibacillus hunanensis]|uniref:Oligopeptide/dipeptide ABC transporter ATP-binding protein n=1 Tax=Paenibacillus hunanensis TaxID=539262 RepID=A0ABU1J569_9BACL|nr:ABC transporter ATP-binding protein [Paenibacillus hunanensis]MDR6246640.1 oligopeptide/dipeptide ABC transporter ATP-binding protein [Paenibacillus hunanensis]GGJ00627.1 ABC transporter ATP-binding protein [Paenibacillus hunanensis]